MSDAFERAAQRAEEEAQRRRSERSARGQRLSFRVHASVFAAVNLMLILVWALTGGGEPWFLYALAGWGIGLAAHFAVVRDAFRP